MPTVPSVLASGVSWVLNSFYCCWALFYWFFTAHVATAACGMPCWSWRWWCCRCWALQLTRFHRQLRSTCCGLVMRPRLCCRCARAHGQRHLMRSWQESGISVLHTKCRLISPVVLCFAWAVLAHGQVRLLFCMQDMRHLSSCGVANGDERTAPASFGELAHNWFVDLVCCMIYLAST